MTLVLRRLLASSTFAIAGALTSISNRLKARLRKEGPAESLEDELDQDYEALDETAELPAFASFTLEITMTDTAIPFRPDWVSPPGDTIADLMEERGWPQTELAVRLGYTAKHVSQLINGKAAVTEDTALRLERVLGGGAAFWLAREAQFRAQRARLAAAGRFSEWSGWFNKLPVKELMQEGAIPKKRMDAKGKPDPVEALLCFFRVASPDDWEHHYARMEVSFRRTRKEQSDIGAISAWLRLGEIETERVVSPQYDRVRFEAALKEIRTLTLRPPEEFEPRLRGLCRESGVALVLIPSIPRAHVSGVARWLSAHRPLIQLSLYGKTNDRFWCTFFHEAAHVLLHGKKMYSSTTMTTTSLSPRKSVKPMPGAQIF